ncbi:MAG: hypothetical protein QXS36_02905 [Candidatus Bathyarchaeia archaeon]|nr:hypothetical protein [Candidatus Bathyarchaeota archaeon]
MSSRRKLLAAREDLAEKAAEIASRRRWTLYEFINDVLEEAIRADSLGVSLREVIDERGVLRDARESGFLLIPARLWYDLVDKAYMSLDEEWMRGLWYECGQWYGKYYGDLNKFAEALKKLFWDLSEADISLGTEEIHVRCILLNLSLSYADLFSRFIEGALDSLGYRLLSRDVSKGAVSMRFARRVP